MSDRLLTSPYARFLDLQEHLAGQELTVTMPFQDRLIGNPLLPALHGGSTAALMEMTAIGQVAVSFPRKQLPRPINVTAGRSTPTPGP
jgi:acyl-coenzyme A thioesterase PaaI-like protein